MGFLARFFGAIGMVSFITVVVAVIVVGAWFLFVGLAGLSIAAFWNWMGLHSYFHMAPLSFWQVIGAGAATKTLDSIVSSKSDGDRLGETVQNVVRQRKGL